MAAQGSSRVHTGSGFESLSRLDMFNFEKLVMNTEEQIFIPQINEVLEPLSDVMPTIERPVALFVVAAEKKMEEDDYPSIIRAEGESSLIIDSLSKVIQHALNRDEGFELLSIAVYKAFESFCEKCAGEMLEKHTK